MDCPPRQSQNRFYGRCIQSLHLRDPIDDIRPQLSSAGPSPRIHSPTENIQYYRRTIHGKEESAASVGPRRWTPE
ncbi:hypothetical protein AVEN_47483-1 [Araneus ventricosus]|uniref:Uncharacterized protein n=1 Tax=Araneus ventricosus TaxID=182803 RepID=A0A4Y2Q4Q3_ARAVE|nr:hypothetical protein AVEN_47483-1 [Araneus ventricosus]